MKTSAKITNIRDGLLLEVVREWLLVEKDVRIVEFPVEPVLDLLHTAHDASEVTVPR